MSPALSTTADVLVIGRGLTGLATAWHLAAAGVQRVAIAGHAPAGAAPGLVFGGQADNFTRVSHAHGATFAADLWRFGDAAFDALAAFCTAEGVPLKRSRFLRLVTSDHELTEARQAVEALKAAGFGVTFSERPAAHPFGGPLTPRVLAVQDDGPRAGVLDAPALLAALERKVKAPSLPRVSRLTPSKDHIEATLADGATIRAQLVVCAAQLGIGALIPELSSALVGVADQWSEAEVDLDAWPGWRDGGVVYGANHTYEWGASLDGKRLRVGGGRYLRPMAGMEATRADADARVTTHLAQQLAKTFVFGQGAKLGPPTPFLDVRPCDELPIIGPMFGESRLLVATGYMGSGLSLGFAAGRALASLITKGAAPELPRRLWPERLRTLES